MAAKGVGIKLGHNISSGTEGEKEQTIISLPNTTVPFNSKLGFPWSQAIYDIDRFPKGNGNGEQPLRFSGPNEK